jgi:peptidoglycan/LPS O-acetylase OafA/YrhL
MLPTGRCLWKRCWGKLDLFGYFLPRLRRLARVGKGPIVRLPLLSSAPASSLTTPSEPNFHPAYRSDIDGLRALAILPVVAFHAFPDWAPGGFVGVDVFFVISGFLISTIIFKSLARNEFSFIEFYIHRVRRIFPALILVMASCFVLGWHGLLGSEFTNLGRHIAAGAGFVLNIVLWREAGYFDIASELKPLLHLWSLAIEEQFYVFFPLLMWVTWRLGFNLLVPVALICLASFAANLYGVRHDAVATFFSLQTRAWELMAGAILAWFSLDGAAKDGASTRLGYAARVRRALYRTVFFRAQPSEGAQDALLNSMISVIGFSLVLVAIFGLNRTIPYPGGWALLPVLGAVLLIQSRRDAWVNRVVLSSRPAVFVGWISYPLYLWHWPLLSFMTIFDGSQPDGYRRALAVGLSLILAWLTFRFVERPIRTSGRSKKLIVGNLVLGVVAMAVLGLNADHLARSYDEPIRKLVQTWEFKQYPNAPGDHRDARYDLPTFGHNNDDKTLIIGDSHANQYVNAVAEAFQRQSATNEVVAPQVMFAVPLGDFLPPSIPAEMLDDPSIRTVVLSYFWALKYGSDRVSAPMRCCNSGLMGVGKPYGPFTTSYMDALDAKLATAVKSWRQAGKQVYFILDNPFGKELAPRSLVKRGFFRDVEIVVTPLSKQEAIRRSEPVRSRLLKIAHETGGKVIDPIEWLCDDVCPALSEDGSPIYIDYDHLTFDTLVHHVRYLDWLAVPHTIQ